MKTSKFASTVAPVVLGLALISAPAFAQTAAPQAADEAADAGDEIVVTGSLISNPNLVQSAPVNVTTAETIALRQNNVAEEVLRDIPGVVPNIGSAVNNGNGGASFVDLRGLGSFRNIVLLDGNRIAPSELLGRVDLNNIPLALVQRVDAYTGGAATTYGADAVSGVVNFVTRRDFAGLEFSVGEKITEKGDGNYFRSDLTLGANFDDGKGNAVLSIGYQNSDPVYQGARDFAIDNISSFTGGSGGSGTSVPSRFSGTRGLTAGVPNVLSPFVQNGVTTAPITRADGTVVPVGTPILAPQAGGAANGGVRQVNAAGQAVGTFARFNFNPFNIFQTPFNRFNIFGAAHYEVADGLEVYTRALFSKNTVNTIIAPSGSFGGSVDIPLSNPYLPTALRNQFCAFNVAPTVTGVSAAGVSTSGQVTYTPRFTPAQCNAAALATSPTDPNFRSVNATLNRRAVEVGPRISNYQTTIFDYRAGVKGDITDSIHFDVNGSYGESENIQTLQNYTLQSRIRTAVFATNTTTCAVGATGGANPAAGTGCVPVNIFGAAGTIAPNQIAYITANSTSAVRTTLAQARGVINGDFGFTIPSAADPVSFAVGTEYRKYSATQRADILAQTPGELGGAGAANPDITGGYRVYEGFGEINVPIVSDKAFFKNLSAEGGIRYSSYKVAAPGNPSYKTTTYKGGLTWAPTGDIKFRGTYAHAVRAPNISELFTPVIVGLTSLTTDPCSGAAPTTNASLRAVCVAQGAAPGLIGSIQNPTASQANISSGGNVNVKPETSNSYTFGTVLTPGFVPGLSLTVDYYNIKIKKAITTPTAADILTACFGADPRNPPASVAASPNCTSIRRNPLTGGLDGDPSITPGLFGSLSNLGALATDGIDVALNYKRDLGFADLTFSTVGNYTFSSKFQSNTITNSLNRECVGFYSSNCASPQPKFQWTTRTTLGFSGIDLSVQWRHIDKFRQEPDDIANGNGPVFAGTLAIPGSTQDGRVVDFGRIPSYDYFDVSARFSVGDHLEFVLTANNILNKQPPLVGLGVGSTAFNSGNTYPSTYDALGRAYAVSAKIKF